MYIDIFGKKRQKVGLHIHTNLSDGKKTPAEVAEIYKEEGYDAIAITDHWRHYQSGDIGGLHVLPGIEYDVGGKSTEEGIYHIVGLCAQSEPDVKKGEDGVQEIIDKIHKAGGLAVLAHPAWSLNTPEMIMKLRDVDATEIYNSVSAVGQSFRPDSSIIIDMVAAQGRDYALLATDDTHYCNGIDNCIAYVMVESDTCEPEKIKDAIINRRFYATQGPEIHLSRVGDKFRVDCSPVNSIYFASNTAWCMRTAKGEGITSAEYTPVPSDNFVRAFVVDKNGKTAWSNIIPLK